MELIARTLKTPRGDLTLRAAELPDAERFREVRLEALRTCPDAFGMAYEDQVGLPIEHWRQRLASGGISAVIDDGKEFVAMAGIAASQGMKVRHKASIWGVFVRPAWRGLGLGSALLESLIDAAKSDPTIRLVHLTVVTTNASAQRLYERLGFRIYGTSPGELFVNGSYLDEHLMVLDLASEQKTPAGG